MITLEGQNKELVTTTGTSVPFTVTLPFTPTADQFVVISVHCRDSGSQPISLVTPDPTWSFLPYTGVGGVSVNVLFAPGSAVNVGSLNLTWAGGQSNVSFGWQVSIFGGVDLRDPFPNSGNLIVASATVTTFTIDPPVALPEGVPAWELTFVACSRAETIESNRWNTPTPAVNWDTSNSTKVGGDYYPTDPATGSSGYYGWLDSPPDGGSYNCYVQYGTAANNGVGYSIMLSGGGEGLAIMGRDGVPGSQIESVDGVIVAYVIGIDGVKI